MAKPVLALEWKNPAPAETHAHKFTCGYCDVFVASERAFHTTTGQEIRILICPHCKRPTFFENAAQHPGVAFGGSVDKLPADIGTLYDEARVCCSTSAYTAAVLILRASC